MESKELIVSQGLILLALKVSLLTGIGEWNAKALRTGNRLRCKEKLVRKLKP